MDKYEALETIKEVWNDTGKCFGDKVIEVSTAFHSSGLDLATTAAFIKATPTELEMFLALGEFDDEIIELISEADPPNTTWTMLAEASEEEIRQAIQSLKDNKDRETGFTTSEFVFQKMIEVSGPSIEQKLGALSGKDIAHVLKKGEDFDALRTKEPGFLKSCKIRRNQGKPLSDSQINWLKDILKRLVEKGAISRNSIDDDQEVCDRILDALEIE